MLFEDNAFIIFISVERSPGKFTWKDQKDQKGHIKFICKLNLLGEFVGPLIPLFLTFGDVYPVFQSQGGSLACVRCCLHAMDFSDSHLVPHLLTSCWPA